MSHVDKDSAIAMMVTQSERLAKAKQEPEKVLYNRYRQEIEIYTTKEHDKLARSHKKERDDLESVQRKEKRDLETALLDYQMQEQATLNSLIKKMREESATKHDSQNSDSAKKPMKMDICRERYDRADLTTGYPPSTRRSCTTRAYVNAEGNLVYSQGSPSAKVTLRNNGMNPVAASELHRYLPQTTGPVYNYQPSPSRRYTLQDVGSPMNAVATTERRQYSYGGYDASQEQSTIRNASSPMSSTLAQDPEQHQDSFSRATMETFTGDKTETLLDIDQNIVPTTPHPSDRLAVMKTRTLVGDDKSANGGAKTKSTPTSVPGTAAGVTYPSFDNMSRESTPLSTVAPSSRRTSSRKRSASYTNTANLQMSTPKKSREERYTGRRVSKEQQYNKNNPKVKYEDTKISFGITYVGYNPTENPQDTTLETSWHQNMFLQMSDSLIFEPHDGHRSFASEQPLLVLSHKYNGKAFVDTESDRFEIYQKTGARLRIQFQQGELKDFISPFEICFTGVMLELVHSPLLGVDQDFTTERAPSYEDHLSWLK